MVFVAGGVHQQHVFGGGVLVGSFHGGALGREFLAEAHVDNLRAVVHGVADGVGHVLVALVAVGHGPHRHDAHQVGREAHHAQVVGAHRPDDARHVGAVHGVGSLDVVVAVVALREVVGVVLHDVGPRVEAQVQRVFQQAALLFGAVLQLLEQGVGVGGTGLGHHVEQARNGALQVGVVGFGVAQGGGVQRGGAQSLLHALHHLGDGFGHAFQLLAALGFVLHADGVRLFGFLVEGKVRLFGGLEGGGGFALEALAAGGHDAGHFQGFGVDVAAVGPAQEVPAVHVVHVAVLVVVHAVAGYFFGIAPQHGLEVDVRRVDARVDDGHDNGLGRPVLE